MSNKKQKNNSTLYNEMEAKYLDNTSITNYALEDKDMVNSLELIRNILLNEHCKDKNILFTNQLGLNLDKVEILKTKKSSIHNSTVDFVVGLAKGQLLLVEAKFDAKNMEKIASEIYRKVDHSKELLISNTSFVGCYKKKIILLSNDKFEQNKRRLLNLLDNDISFYPLNVEQFYLFFFKPNNH